jgi:hypothetical protein
MTGPAYRAAVAAEIEKLPPHIIGARCMRELNLEGYVAEREICRWEDDGGATDPDDLVRFQHQERYRYFRVLGLNLATWARPIEGQGVEIFIDWYMPTPEVTRLKRKCGTILKKVGRAVGSPDRKTSMDYGFERLWTDRDLRLEKSPHFQVFVEEEEGRFLELRVIQDLRSVLLCYWEKYWTSAPISGKTKGPGRPKGIELDPVEVRKLRLECRLSQKKLAEACEPRVPHYRIIRAEKGRGVSEGFPEILAKTFSRLLERRIEPRGLLKK